MCAVDYWMFSDAGTGILATAVIVRLSRKAANNRGLSVRHQWGHCSRFHMSLEFVHDVADRDTEGVRAADDFEQAAGGEFFD